MNVMMEFHEKERAVSTSDVTLTVNARSDEVMNQSTAKIRKSELCLEGKCINKQVRKRHANKCAKRGRKK